MNPLDLGDFVIDDDVDDWAGPCDDEFEDEQRAKRGTSECDGLCDPQCMWCLVAHCCPDDCAGGECPYDTLMNDGAGGGV